MADAPSGVVTARLRLTDVWGGDDVVREIPLAEVEMAQRGVTVGTAFYPWSRVVSCEWEVVEQAPEEELLRPRQLLVRVLLSTPSGGVEEHRVNADRFEIGTWTLSLLVPERVEPEIGRVVFRRLTVPWHRVLEYERFVAEASAGGDVPARPDRSAGAGEPSAEEAEEVTDVLRLAPTTAEGADGDAQVRPEAG
jgi:hypothetical protein